MFQNSCLYLTCNVEPCNNTGPSLLSIPTYRLQYGQLKTQVSQKGELKYCTIHLCHDEWCCRRCSSSRCSFRMVSNTLSTFSGRWSRIIRGITASCMNSSATAQRTANLDPPTPDFLYDQTENIS